MKYIRKSDSSVSNVVQFTGTLESVVEVLKLINNSTNMYILSSHIDFILLHNSSIKIGSANLFNGYFTVRPLTRVILDSDGLLMHYNNESTFLEDYKPFEKIISINTEGLIQSIVKRAIGDLMPQIMKEVSKRMGL